jgi:type VI secretion system protein ImpL
VIREAPAIERVYGRLKADCNARFAPVTVPRLLNGRDSDLIGGASALPGCFTREGYEKFFKQAAENASGREVGGSDWVLASATKDDLRATGTPDKVRSDLRGMYFAEYAREWRKFLRGVAVQKSTGLDGEARALGRLAEPQSSPIAAIVKRAHDETSWDSPIENKGRQIVNRVVDSVQGERGKVVDKLEMGQGVLERQFVELSNFVRGSASGQVGGPGTPIDTYLQNLNRVKTRIAAVAAGNRGEAAKAFLAQTLGGQGELHEAYTFADTTALGRMDQETREALRAMLLRPLTLAASALVEPATQELNQQWATAVYAPWASNLAGRFPFADTTTEASPVEIARFFKPNEGLVAKFRDQQLGALVARAGDGYIARRWGDVGINFRPEFLAALTRFTSGGGVANVLNGDGEGLRFELRPDPTPELSEILLTIDGRQLRYRNEPQEWYGFAWPGGTQDAGASLQVVGLRGGGETVGTHPGKWGFMRLLSRAQLRPLDRSLYQVVWRTSQGFNVRFTLRVEGGGQLYLPSDLRGVGLPQKIAE